MPARWTPWCACLQLPGLLQVQQLVEPTYADMQQSIMQFSPNVLYLYAGCAGDPEVASSPLHTLLLQGDEPFGVEMLPQLVAPAGLHALIVNSAVDYMPMHELQPYVPHIVHWKPGAALASSHCVPAC